MASSSSFNVPLLTNSKGKASCSFTMLFISFNITCLWLLLSIIAPLFGITSVPSFDGTSAIAFLGPIILNYFGSKWVDREDSSPQANINNNQ